MQPEEAKEGAFSVIVNLCEPSFGALLLWSPATIVFTINTVCLEPQQGTVSLDQLPVPLCSKILNGLVLSAQPPTAHSQPQTLSQ